MGRVGRHVCDVTVHLYNGKTLEYNKVLQRPKFEGGVLRIFIYNEEDYSSNELAINAREIREWRIEEVWQDIEEVKKDVGIVVEDRA